MFSDDISDAVSKFNDPPAYKIILTIESKIVEINRNFIIIVKLDLELVNDDVIIVINNN